MLYYNIVNIKLNSFQLTNFCQRYFLKGQNKEALEESGKTATEAIENIRTVASLCQEDRMLVLYKEQLDPPYKTALRKSHLTGIAFAASTAVMFFAYATAFYFGAYMIKENEMTYTEVFLWVSICGCGIAVQFIHQVFRALMGR